MDKKIAQLYDNGKVDQAIHLLVQKIDQKPQNIENYLQLSKKINLIQQRSRVTVHVTIMRSFGPELVVILRQ